MIANEIYSTSNKDKNEPMEILTKETPEEIKTKIIDIKSKKKR